MEIGDRVRVVALGEFHGHVGVIVRIHQHGENSQRYYRIVFDDHPWQEPGIDWAFIGWELESEEEVPAPAPDLLAACEAAAASLAADEEIMVDWDPDDDNGKLLAQLRAAIAKVRGEAHP
jgi:hypothetical protein